MLSAGTHCSFCPNQKADAGVAEDDTMEHNYIQ
jgi:hypothetical protein